MISLSLCLYFCLKIDSFYKSAHMPYSLVFLFVLKSFFLLFLLIPLLSWSLSLNILSDLSPIIGLSLTAWLTDSRLEDLIDVTQVCEDVNSKLVDVVTIADFDDEDHVGNSLLQI